LAATKTPKIHELWGHREAFMYEEMNIFRLFLGLRACQEADSSQARRAKNQGGAEKIIPYLRCKEFSNFRNLRSFHPN
jgi:hypothetical protein